MDSKRTNDRDPSLVWFVGLVVPEQYYFLPVHFFTLLVPIAQQPGQAGVLGHLSLEFRTIGKLFLVLIYQ
jgi:hypothetical protein